MDIKNSVNLREKTLAQFTKFANVCCHIWNVHKLFIANCLLYSGRVSNMLNIKHSPIHCECTIKVPVSQKCWQSLYLAVIIFGGHYGIDRKCLFKS